MSLKPDDLAQIILDSIDDDEPPTELYTLNIHEARMLAHAIANLRDTTAGRELMAEGWDALIESMSGSGEFHDVDLRTMQRLNPYREGNA